MRLGQWLLAAISVLCISTQSSAGIDVCQDPRLPILGSNQTCSSATILFREHGTEKPAELARLNYTYNRPSAPPGKFYRDPPDPASTLFLRPADRRLIQLRHNLTLHNPLITFRALGFAHEHPPGTYSTALIELVGGVYCTTYRMKSPFQGIYRDCGREKPDVDTIGYQPGVLTRQAALELTCAFIESHENRNCRAHQVVSNWGKRDDAGTYHFIYVFKLPSRGANSAPTDSDYLVYQINPINRKAESLGTVADEKAAIKLARQ